VLVAPQQVDQPCALRWSAQCGELLRQLLLTVRAGLADVFVARGGEAVRLQRVQLVGDLVQLGARGFQTA